MNVVAASILVQILRRDIKRIAQHVAAVTYEAPRHANGTNIHLCGSKVIESARAMPLSFVTILIGKTQ